MDNPNPQDPPSVHSHKILRNQYNGLDLEITHENLTVSINTNEQRYIHIMSTNHYLMSNNITAGSHPMKWISEGLSGLCNKAGRHPFDIPEATVDLLDKIIDEQILSQVPHTPADWAHWCKVNIRYGGYGPGDKEPTAIDGDVAPLPERVHDYMEPLPRPKGPQASVP